MNRKRKESETFSQYKENMREENRMLKIKLEGDVFWPSKSLGTYKKIK